MTYVGIYEMPYTNGFSTPPSARTFSNSAKYACGHPGMYGSSSRTSSGVQVMEKQSPFVPRQRKQLNIAAVSISLFIPTALFALMYWVMSFSPHYKTPLLCYFVVLAGLCFVGMTAYVAFEAVRRKQEAGVVQFVASNQSDAHREPTWLIFLFATCLQAWFIGVALGDMNYVRHMQPYYDISNLETYPSVDPSSMRGQQLMDAGRVMFTSGSTLDLTRSRGYKSLQNYCVAPIVSDRDTRPVPSYDFWAVGVGCCSGSQADFHCGEFNNPRASAGLRLMQDDQRAFFRLAVQQAEAAYNIKAEHPLFFHWMQDPIAEVNEYMDEGFKYYFFGVTVHFVFQFFLVLAACIVFAKITAN